MNQENRPIPYVEEDTIDLRELWKVLIKRKQIVVFTTVVITFLAILYTIFSTPVYQVAMKIRTGSHIIANIDKVYVTESFQNSLDLKYELEVLYNKREDIENKTSFMTSVKIPKKLDNFLEIDVQANSNAEAEKLLDEIYHYIYDKHIKLYATLLKEKEFKIKKLQQSVYRHEHVTLKRLRLELEALKDGPLKDVNNQINYLKKYEKKQIEKRIEIIRKLDVKAIEENIAFIQEVAIPTLVAKTEQYKSAGKKIKTHLESSRELVEQYKADNLTLASVTLFDVRSDERTLFELSNKVFDLEQKKLDLERKTIPSLKRKIDRLREEAILKLDIQNQKLIQITLPKLQYKQSILLNKTIPEKSVEIEKLLNETIPNLQEQVIELKIHSSAPYLVKTKMINDYIVSEHPVKPRKKLIVIVGFISGLMLSVFLAFFLEFISGGSRKNEET